MNLRLPPQPGEWIDRSRPMAFRFEGRDYQGYFGDLISSALWANGVHMQGRSFKYHRPRGIYSLAGHDANAVFEDETRTNIRGDQVGLRSGMDLRAVNTRGGLDRDRLSIVDRFSKLMPVGFYYKAFHTPRWLFPRYEKQIRQIAGLGAIRAGRTAQLTPKGYGFCQLLVVGAGPSGLSAALAAADQGVDVLLVDEHAHLGGSLSWQSGGDEKSREVYQELVNLVQAHQRITVRTKTQVAGCYADLWVALVDDVRLTKLRAQAMVVASGVMEQPAVFGNNDLPGVMLASAAQRLIHLYAVKPWQQCVTLAANSDGYRAALDLHRAGISVAAVVDLRDDAGDCYFAAQVRQAGIRVLMGSMIYEAVPGAGKRSIRGAVVCPLGEDGCRRESQSQVIDCDGIAMSVGWAPAGAPLYQVGGKFSYDPTVEQLVPRELPRNVFAAGRVRGVFGLDDRLMDGRRAGLEAAQKLGHGSDELPAKISVVGPAPSHPYPIFRHTKKKNFVELDEDLHFIDLVNAHQEGFDNIELIKRYSTVGMGPSQGKIANMNAVRVLARLNGDSIDQTGTTTSRPFHQPVPFEYLAGRRFHPTRRTPMHRWHQKTQAEFIHAGSWLRPEYYANAGQDRETSILQEARHVREYAGLMDVSTLGKIEVAGPDAVTFLERIYTGRFAKQTTGKLRYVLACDEMGVVIDDGVAVRLSDNHFYVTATTSGAAAVYREMLRWALIWDLDVQLVDVTGHLAAMNLAGPQSREVLQKLTSVDVSPEGFPFLGVRRGEVAGVPASLMRVGFVGELGYEIHVPAGYAAHVWEEIMRAGASSKVRPFGVEAQRLLRLEKGHLIVGQDTDALTNPYEANMAWAVARKKQFFVGQRTLQILNERPLTRKLVGVKMAPGYRGPFPEESHLIIEQGEMIGRVTSFAPQSTLGYGLGLVFVHPDRSEAGTKVRICVDRGAEIEAEIAPTPFYDPDDLRQK